MSHFVPINFRVENIEVLRESVENLGYKLIKGGVARGYKNKQADYVIRLNGPYDVAVVREGDRYRLEADFWRGHVERELGKGMSKLIREYTFRYARLLAQQRGLYPTEVIEHQIDGKKWKVMKLEEVW